MGQHHEFDPPALEQRERKDDKNFVLYLIQCQGRFLKSLGNSKTPRDLGLSRQCFSHQSTNISAAGDKFGSIFSEPLFDKCVIEPHVHYTMGKISHSNKQFKNFPCARYATDVTFQQANRPSVFLEKVKKYYSGNHKLYGYKVEVSVLPICIAVHCTNHYPGSIADIDIFYKNLDFHDVGLAKSEKEATRDGLDSGPFKQEYPKY